MGKKKKKNDKVKVIQQVKVNEEGYFVLHYRFDKPATRLDLDYNAVVKGINAAKGSILKTVEVEGPYYSD